MPISKKHIFTALYENFPDPVVIVDAQKTITSVNPTTQVRFAYDLDELIGQPARMLYASDEDYDLCLNRVNSADGGSDDAIFRFKRKDHSIFVAKLRVMRVSDDAAVDQGFVGVIHDISDYIELDRERRRIGDILDAAMMAIPEGFAIFDKDEKLLVYNEAYRKICAGAGQFLHVGMTAEDIMRAAQQAGNYPLALPNQADAGLWVADRLRDFRNPGGTPSVFPYGDDRWLQAENLKTDDGSTVVLRIDVTALKKTELALDRQRLEYVALVQNIPDFITRISKAKLYTFVNQRYATFIGLPADELIGKPLMDFVPAVDRDRLNTVLDGLSPEHPIVTHEQHRSLADGRHVWILWSNMAIFDGETLVEFVTVGRDITELKLQQLHIAQQRAELERKNEALNQFTATVSHDLKAPLRHMSMFSEMISDDVGNGMLDDIPVYAQHLRQSARRMDLLIDSLLDYSQIADQIGNWSVVKMAHVVHDAVLNLDSFIREAGATLEIGTLPDVHGDPELLKRLFQNLIGNAVKYGRPDVKPVIRIRAEQEDRSIRFTVEDNGIGIDPRFAGKIFDVFQRLHRDESVYKGTGIGLALARRIVESHNGSIALDTTYEQGARFEVILPAGAAVAAENGKPWSAT